ncbi:DUF883 family protein [Agrobacterium sp. ES01]|uniref:DUF883 family protein n=1 Tax=Agrobacterium sp. ES01 TaxID=3420714 RepID=UPI003D0EF221
MATSTAQKAGPKTEAATAEDIAAQIDNLRADIAVLTQTVSDFGAGKADQAVRQAGAFKDTLAENAAAVANDAKDRFVSAESDFEDRIRANPLASVGIAAGVGFLFAIFTRR